jgi:hypothetical protein
VHTTHLHPRTTLTTMLALLALGIFAVLIPTQLADTHLAFGGGSRAAAPAIELSHPATTPQWISHPLASPLASLRGGR